MKKFSGLLLVALLSGATTLGGYKLIFDEDVNNTSALSVAPAQNNYTRTVGYGAENIDFTAAADQAVHTVVHVKNVSYSTAPNNPFMEFFYGYRGGEQQAQVGTGSGVIITEDGYIVTNNHVIQNASELEVTLNNNKSYKARLVGTDSKMDIALLKVDTDEKLPYATFGNSDNIKVGEWVLAVGNPYNLTSTVTAGIVSAKARNLTKDGLQSFIQTDAAVNPGNSGGALVNTRGELIGINTLITSMTGSYVGYSFAVPSNVARKIIEDIMEYGNVQRGVLGVQGGELNASVSKELGINETNGFYVNSVVKGSGAEKAGVKKGDIIVEIDNRAVNGFSDLNAAIVTKRPDDVVRVGINRDGRRITLPVKLSKNEIYSYSGLDLENLTAAEKKNLKLNYGVRIKDITDERFMPYYEDLKGGIILSIDNVKAKDIETVSDVLSSKGPNEKTRVEMVTRNGQLVRFYI
ncbi:trypsin-like peptidase domain-containing protein [Flavobacterium coralii]|uniref:trypsin-like peptidase domain-containing protein n=1 Tax=Flavobacterium coralii TaxID=2838017 RepID=UPI000C536198|nr:trypsin-like peptidase domain-containing protein [Flavobacterium coralii]MBF00544.1 serine protease [Flavobacterium sp.]MBY8962610.1 trypsin-like peptidase domain-containing protein [Flavobacterium coralii]|tara:strand:- start:5253 stop:6644 length:1392 start_codon:yes stop_codon:yes gene_type:complete